MILAEIITASTAAGQGHWSTGPEPSACDSTMALIDSKNVLFGGTHECYSGQMSVYIYHVPNRTWTSTTNVPVAMVATRFARLGHGNVIAAGGANAFGFSQAAAVFHPKKSQWISVKSMLVRRCGHGMATLAAGHVIAAGGAVDDDGDVTNSVEMFNQSANTWRGIASMTDSRSGFMIVTLADGRVLACGGQDRRASWLKSAEIYDPKTDKWTPVCDMPTERSDAMASLLPDGRVLVAGGYHGNASDFTYLDSAIIYDATLNVWEKAPNMPAVRARGGAVTTSVGVFVAGGSNATNEPMTSALTFIT